MPLKALYIVDLGRAALGGMIRNYVASLSLNRAANLQYSTWQTGFWLQQWGNNTL